MAKQAMLDMISYGRVGTGNLDSILMMSGRTTETSFITCFLLHSIYR